MCFSDKYKASSKEITTIFLLIAERKEFEYSLEQILFLSGKLFLGIHGLDNKINSDEIKNAICQSSKGIIACGDKTTNIEADPDLWQKNLGYFIMNIQCAISRVKTNNSNATIMRKTIKRQKSVIQGMYSAFMYQGNESYYSSLRSRVYCALNYSSDAFFAFLEKLPREPTFSEIR